MISSLERDPKPSLMRFLILLLLPIVSAYALDLGDLDQAEIELEELVSDWETEWANSPTPETQVALGTSLQALGIVERQMGKPEEALAHLEEACLKLAGAPGLVDAQEALALTKQDLGALAESEDLLRQVLKSREGDSSAPVAYANSLDHLALNLLQQGRYPEVGVLLKSALQAAPAESLTLRARLTGHQGRLLHTLGSHARAIHAFEEALAIEFEDAPLRLSLQSQRALSKLRLGHLEEAVAETESVASDARELFQATPLQAVPYQNNLGAIALAQGEFRVAADAFAKALDLARTQLEEDHPGLATPLNNLGVALQQLGDYQAAEEALAEAHRIQERHYADSPHLRSAETLRNLARNDLLREETHSQARVEEATTRGISLLETLVAHGTERDRLNFLERFDLVSLPCITGDAKRIANVLLATKSRLLDTMLGASENHPAPVWQDIQKSLPESAAFIDCCRYRPLNPDDGLRYGAILLLPTGPPEWIQLGSEEELLDWLGGLRERLAWQAAISAGGDSSNPPTLTLKMSLRALERDFWEPISKHLPPTTENIAFSPDGALHFLPLAALLDRDGIPLSHRLPQVCSVASGRALMEAPATTELGDHPWTVMTISDFPTASAPSDGDPIHTLLNDLGPMPGTAREAKKLRKVAPKESIFLSDSKVTEATLRALPAAPNVLHLGCHAFYIGPERHQSDLALDFDESAGVLRSSGLVLYRGAEWDQHDGEGQDDLLYPDEIAQLPLTGTRLVTLSSCDSGAGTPVAGEGLLGLHRAFSLAGAQEVAVALWPVSDQSTPEFMQRFYQLARLSNRPAQALWQAQSEFLPPADSPDFEAAVLRYAPFNLSQSGPISVGPAIEAPRLTSNPPWKLILCGVLAAALTRFLVTRLQKRRSAP